MAARRKDSTPSLFSTSEQMELLDEQRVKGKVEALGQTFASEAERREHFRDRLRERLEDPQFRALPGFPQGSDEVLPDEPVAADYQRSLHRVSAPECTSPRAASTMRLPTHSFSKRRTTDCERNSLGLARIARAT